MKRLQKTFRDSKFTTIFSYILDFKPLSIKHLATWPLQYKNINIMHHYSNFTFVLCNLQHRHKRLIERDALKVDRSILFIFPKPPKDTISLKILVVSLNKINYDTLLHKNRHCKLSTIFNDAFLLL